MDPGSAWPSTNFPLGGGLFVSLWKLGRKTWMPSGEESMDMAGDGNMAYLLFGTLVGIVLGINIAFLYRRGRFAATFVARARKGLVERHNRTYFFAF